MVNMLLIRTACIGVAIIALRQVPSNATRLVAGNSVKIIKMVEPLKAQRNLKPDVSFLFTKRSKLHAVSAQNLSYVELSLKSLGSKAKFLRLAENKGLHWKDDIICV